MVRKISWLVLVSFVGQICQASIPPVAGGLMLVWQGAKTPACQRLVESFLSELRSLASDRTIQLEARQPASKNDSDFAMQCEEHESPPRTLVVRQGSESITMHYLAKAGGFDATDWLPFQQKFLRPGIAGAMAPEEPSLGLQPSAKPDGIPLPMAQPGLATNPDAAATSILKRWWFWALVGGAGAGAFALIRTGQHDSNSMNVEIR